MSRWERRAVEAERSGDEATLQKSMEHFEAAVIDVAERSEWDPQWKAVPPPSRAAEFTGEYLAAQSDDELEQQWNELHLDPRSQALIEAEWDRRAAAESLRVEQENAEIREVWEETLYPDCIQSFDDGQLQDMWADLHEHRDLQERIEAEWDRRAVDAAGPALSGADLEELEWAYNNLSPAKYQEVERRLLTDPTMWSSNSNDGAPVVKNGTVKDAQERERLAYFEYQFERYMAAEAKCRGHMLNKRGEALGVDPQSLLYGNSKRMHAYASDEFKAAVGATGGHMSFARFAALRGASSKSAYGAHNAETFQDVAYA
ncbi:hypothetical protein GS489_00370 [Rhodococcus hoagii]|nr:hypothetical protein [Prescottella equi]